MKRFITPLLFVLLSTPSFAQTPEEQLGWTGYYLAIPFRPIADSAVIRKANVKAVKVYMRGSDTFYADMRDTASANCEIQVFNRRGQCVTVYRNKIISKTFSKSSLTWNKEGNYIATSTYGRKDDEAWKRDGRSTWKYDSAGNRILSLTEHFDGKKFSPNYETRYTYDALGRKVTGITYLPTYHPYPELDTTTYTYPHPDTIRTVSQYYLQLPDSFVHTHTLYSFEAYRNGRLMTTGDTYAGRDSIETSYSYDKEGRLKSVESFRAAFAGSDEMSSLLCRISYTKDGLPLRMIVTCGKYRQDLYFSYLYY